MKKNECPVCGYVAKPGTMPIEKRMTQHMKRHPLYNPKRKFTKTKKEYKGPFCDKCGEPRNIQSRSGLCKKCYHKSRPKAKPKPQRYCECGHTICQTNQTGRCQKCAAIWRHA